MIKDMVRLQCNNLVSKESAKDVQELESDNLSVLAAALDMDPEYFIDTIARVLHIVPEGYGETKPPLPPDILRSTLTTLLSVRATWDELYDCFDNGYSTETALAVLSKGVLAADEKVLAASASLLLGVIKKATEKGNYGVSDVFSSLLARLPACRAARISSVARSLRNDAIIRSSETHWLEVPLVPTVNDIRSGDAWLSKPQLQGLQLTYESKLEYLERLFRLLRADALANMSLKLYDLSLQKRIDDRDLPRYKNLTVLGYRAHGGEVQVALSITPVKKPRKSLVEDKRLLDGSLVCISPSGKWLDVSTLLWAIVVPVKGALEINVVVLEILPGAGVDAPEALKALLEAPEGTSEMAENPEFFTTYHFALKRLQTLGEAAAFDEENGKKVQGPILPFETELVDGILQFNKGLSDVDDVQSWAKSVENVQRKEAGLLNRLDPAQ